MRVVVLGGTRFIGPPMVHELAAAGHEITVFHRGQTQAELPPGVRRILGDRAELARHAKLLASPAPDVVLDMRPLDERDAQAVVAAFRGVARRVVAVSSCDVYRAYGVLIGTEKGALAPVPATEDSELRSALHPYRAQATGPDDFRWHYDKIPAERVFLGDPDLPGTVLRLPMVYGPGDYQHRLHPYLRRMDDRRPAILLGAAMARWLSPRSFVEDVAHAIVLAATEDVAIGRVYNVAEEANRSELDWVRRIAEATGWKGEIVVVPDSTLPAHLQEEMRLEQDLAVGSQRIRAELGYAESHPPAERLARTVAWERAHPPEPVDPAAFDYPAEDAVLVGRNTA